ncbi:MAG TPA: transcription termination/antitermination protein NusG [Candidatus Atopostipes pullistercoris]|uniref:Transcription termination/antitermination protein NusG n=1 Tax=Candidatus Atopostipes pullistercoris TaxID=2838467 RepID=A0A9D2JYR6_9LACT|nr:transcription termination/antitermination protein NusG [Candidatus Atopostipes pullistercoris]
MSEEKAWYVLHTYSGYEKKIQQNLSSRMKSMGMEDNIFEVLVPEQEVYEEKNGEMSSTMKKTFPGYVLVQMVMSDEAWYVVRNTPGVTGFVGSHGAGSKPSPLLPEEVDSVFRSMGMNPRKVEIQLSLGEHVEIISGAFAGMEGVVESFDEDKGKVTVSVEMFGRETDTELDYSEVKQIEDGFSL